MPTLKISAQYREPPMLIVPSAAGFPFVFKPATRTRGLCRLSTTLGMAMTAAVLWIAVVSFAPAAAAARSDYHISAGCASAVHECSVLAGQYSQHDWLRPSFRAEVRSASAWESPAIATGHARQKRYPSTAVCAWSKQGSVMCSAPPVSNIPGVAPGEAAACEFAGQGQKTRGVALPVGLLPDLDAHFG